MSLWGRPQGDADQARGKSRPMRGDGAWRDMWLVASPMTALAALFRLLRLGASPPTAAASSRGEYRPINNEVVVACMANMRSVRLIVW